MEKFYLFLNLVELIFCAVYLFCSIFIRKGKRFSALTQMLIALSMVVINVFQLIIELKLDKSFVFTIILIPLWAFNACMAAGRVNK